MAEEVGKENLLTNQEQTAKDKSGSSQSKGTVSSDVSTPGQKDNHQDSRPSESGNFQEQVNLKGDSVVSKEQTESSVKQSTLNVLTRTEEHSNKGGSPQKEQESFDQSGQCQGVISKGMLDSLEEPTMTRREPLAQLQNVTQGEDITASSKVCPESEKSASSPDNTLPIESTVGSVNDDIEEPHSSHEEQVIPEEEKMPSQITSKEPNAPETAETSDETPQLSGFIEALQQLDECLSSAHNSEMSASEQQHASQPSSQPGTSCQQSEMLTSTGKEGDSTSTSSLREPQNGNHETQEASQQTPGSLTEVQSNSDSPPLIPDTQNKENMSEMQTMPLENNVATFLSLSDSDDFPVTNDLSVGAISDGQISQTDITKDPQQTSTIPDTQTDRSAPQLDDSPVNNAASESEVVENPSRQVTISPSRDSSIVGELPVTASSISPSTSQPPVQAESGGEAIEVAPIVVAPEGTTGLDLGPFHYDMSNQNLEETSLYDNTPTLDSYAPPPTPSMFGQPIVIAPSDCDEPSSTNLDTSRSGSSTTTSESDSAQVTDEDCLITFAKVKPPSTSPPKKKKVPTATLR